MDKQELFCVVLGFVAAYITAALFVPTMAAFVTACAIVGVASFAWYKLRGVWTNHG